VEGPIDSLFLPNTIAVSGSSFDTPTMQALKSVVTIVGDNEPRSREIVKILKKNIDLGYKVCMLPHTVKEKDINELVLSGYDTNEILELIDANTFQGINAQLKFVEWKLV
jgi:2-hydroxy-3-keto-5-methylthiopentenyl-1-phosphate phosphatase